MNIIKCPECNSKDFTVFKKEGSIYEGRIVEVIECLNCDAVYDVVAEITKIKIKTEESQYK